MRPLGLSLHMGSNACILHIESIKVGKNIAYQTLNNFTLSMEDWTTPSLNQKGEKKLKELVYIWGLNFKKRMKYFSSQSTKDVKEIGNIDSSMRFGR